jgi:predicted RNA-binding Zn-ribbon protein involved in translation (DUF1610 family)
MRARGFKKVASGTNRVVYRFLEDTRFLVKIALDKVGLKDNPAEYQLQHMLKPYVTKVFQVSPCGTVAFVERVEPITSATEFASIADDIYYFITEILLGKYVIDDFGTRYFMNWGLRIGFGPCLLDFPYVYEIDGKKLFCNKILPDGMSCGGTIDYDEGFNQLRCGNCGTNYQARDLGNENKKNLIVIEGGTRPVKISIVKNGEVITPAMESSTIIKPAPKKVNKKDTQFRVSFTRGGVTSEAVVETITPDSASENPLKVSTGKQRGNGKGKKNDTRFINPKSTTRGRGPNGRYISRKSNFIPPMEATENSVAKPYYIDPKRDDEADNSVDAEY